MVTRMEDGGILFRGRRQYSSSQAVLRDLSRNRQVRPEDKRVRGFAAWDTEREGHNRPYRETGGIVSAPQGAECGQWRVRGAAKRGPTGGNDAIRSGRALECGAAGGAWKPLFLPQPGCWSRTRPGGWIDRDGMIGATMTARSGNELLRTREFRRIRGALEFRCARRRRQQRSYSFR